jgi:hydroxymethylpyrimidine pyrophosphatase-like HAD family hydrolase
MVVRVLALDYDGTIADNGSTAIATTSALARVRASGRRLVLVTGRILDDLRRVCPDFGRMFDAVVAENGALLYLPANARTVPLAAAPDPALLRALERRRVAFNTGTCIVATTTRFADAARAAIHETRSAHALELNKDSLMLVPAGVTKGTGLRAALAELGAEAAATAAIGDAENDQSLLAACGLGVAVADAVPALRALAQHVTRAPGSRGVIEFVEQLLARS